MSHEDKPWSVAPKTVDYIVYVLYGLCALSVIMDWVIHRHEKLGFATTFGFYAAYGFIACVGLVLAARVMRRFLMRSEDYYIDNSEADNGSPPKTDGETEN